MEGIKLETGKFFKLENGDKVFISANCQSPFYPKDQFTYCGHIAKKAMPLWFNAKGESFDEDIHPSIVAEWKEPKRIKGWLNIDADNCPHSIHPTRAEADAQACRDRIACIEIDVLEGQGLDGSAAR